MAVPGQQPSTDLNRQWLSVEEMEENVRVQPYYLFLSLFLPSHPLVNSFLSYYICYFPCLTPVIFRVTTYQPPFHLPMGPP